MRDSIRYTNFPIVCVLLLTLVVALPTFLFANPEIDLPFEKFVLPNGLQVILHEDHKLPIVQVNSWFHVGSKNEEQGRTGFAHLFEHMMFQGSQNASGEYFDWAEHAGANLREAGVNGTTNQDRTNYFVTAPSGNLEFLLWLESDRVATLLEDLTEEKLKNQQEVVRNEIRQGVENRPYGKFWEMYSRELFPAGHPYSWATMGSHRDLAAATMDDVKAFFSKFYTPNNLSLAIAGDFGAKEARSLVEKYYGKIPPGPNLIHAKTWIPRLNCRKEVVVKDRVPQARLYLLWPAPNRFHPDEAKLQAAASILFEGVSSRVYRSLVYDKQLSSDAPGFLMPGEIAGTFLLWASAREQQNLPEMEKVILSEISRLAEEGPSRQEVQRFKNKMAFRFVSALERVSGFNSKANILNEYNVFFGDPGKIREDFQRYQELTAEGVKNAVKKWLTPEYLCIKFFPENTSKAGEPEIDRARTPDLGKDKDFFPPKIETTTLENGLKVLVVIQPSVPKVLVGLAIKGGGSLDSPEKAGLAEFVSSMLPRGTKNYSAFDLTDAFANMGTSLTTSVNKEYTWIGSEFLNKDLDTGMDLLAQVIRQPGFKTEEIERVRKINLDRLKQEMSDPTSVARRAMFAIAYGKNHPHGLPVSGFSQSIEKLSEVDVVDFHGKFYAPNYSAIIFVGKTTLAEAVELAAEHFGDWPRSAGELPIVTSNNDFPHKLFFIDWPNAPQSVISQISRGPGWKNPDFYSFRLADAIYGGGGFGTRLMVNLREDKGYSYGVYSSILDKENDGFWVAGGGVQGEKTVEAFLEFQKEIKGISGENPISAKEFEFAKSRYLRGFSQGFESLGQIAEKIAGLWGKNQPLDIWEKEHSFIKDILLDDAQITANKYYSANNLSYIVVGDKSALPKLKELGLGEIVTIDPKAWNFK